MLPNVGYQRSDRFYRFLELGDGLTYFPRGTPQQTVILNGNHRSKTESAIAMTSRACTTTGGTNQTNI